MKSLNDKIIFSPGDIDPDFRPVGKDTGKETFIVGTFNPGMTRLKNNNILLVIRVAEALKKPIGKGYVLTPRMDSKKKKFVLDKFPRKIIKFKDPREIDIIQENKSIAMRLTGISWLLPVELTPDGLEIIKIHYNKVMFPQTAYQEYGIEDPRITKIKNKYYMTVVGVSSNMIGTCLYESANGIDYKLKGLLFNHQNRDVVLFPNKIKNKYIALTRPEGKANIAYPPKSKSIAGRQISMAFSPDLIHWAPYEKSVLTLQKDTLINDRIGACAPPIPIKIKGKDYFLNIFHGVEYDGTRVGKYRTFAALHDKKDPAKIVKVNYKPLIESNPKLKKQIKGRLFLKRDVVFTTGLLPHEDNYIICSGELDTAVRTTVFSKKQVHKFLIK